MQISPYQYRTKIDELLSTGKNKSYAVAAVTVFFVLLMSFAGIIPALSSLGIQSEENQKRTEIIQKLETKLALLKNFVREKEAKKDVITFFDTIFPTKLDQVQVVRKTLELSERSKVDIASYNFQKPTTIDNTFIPPIDGVSPQTKYEILTLNGSGSHSSIIEFLKNIEGSTEILNIINVVVTKKPASSTVSQDEYTYTVKVRYYYFDVNFIPENQTSV